MGDQQVYIQNVHSPASVMAHRSVLAPHSNSSLYPKATLVSVLPPISTKDVVEAQNNLKPPSVPTESSEEARETYNPFFANTAYENAHSQCSSGLSDSSNASQSNGHSLKNIVLMQSIVRMWLIKRRYLLLAKTFRIRSEVVREILTSEKRYNKQLLTMIELFLKPLREAIADQSESSDSDSTSEEEERKDEGEGYTEDDIFQIFSHLEIIYNLSNFLILQLAEKYAHGWRAHRTLGDVFIQIGPYLKTLKQYVENYDNALLTLKRLKSASYAFAARISAMEDNPRCQSLDLASHLIVPVQRVPRYILLLQTLQHNTPTDHPDSPLLTRAIAELKKVASFINKGIGEDNDIGVLAYLQGLADAQWAGTHSAVELIQTHRKLVKHGVVTKKSLRDDDCTPRELYLLTDLLVVVSDIMNVSSLQRIDKIIPLVTTTLIDNVISEGSNSTSFVVASPMKTFLFVCENIDMKIEWMTKIQTAITTLLHAHPNNARQRQEWSVDYKNNMWQVIRQPQAEDAPVTTEKVGEVETHSRGETQLAQLQKLLALNNKGKIRIKKACTGLVEEILGPYLQSIDVCPHYSADGTFLVFPPSETVLWLFAHTGAITLANKGTAVVRLLSHVRKCGAEHEGKHHTGKMYDLLPGEISKFPFRGHWAIEVMSGDCADLQVINFSIAHGDAPNDMLGMVDRHK